MKLITLLLICLFACAAHNTAQAQILEKLGKKIEKKVKERADRKADEAIDKGLDKVEGTAGGKSSRDENNGNNNDAGNNEAQSAGEGEVSTFFKVNTNFDFVAGDKVLFLEDFSRVAPGDFPSQWNTNGTGQVVTLEGYEGKWLEMQSDYTYHPEFTGKLPLSFTLEFDLIYRYHTEDFDYNKFGIYIIAAGAEHRDDPVFRYGFAEPGVSGGGVEFHAYWHSGDHSDDLNLEIKNWKNGSAGPVQSKTQAGYIQSMKNNAMHISLWRQGTRVRMYVNDKKVADLPRLLYEGDTYDQVKFGYEDKAGMGRAYVANLRLAESSPDLRQKLLTEGHFVTSGILFDTGSDIIRPESYGVLKQIAGVLLENEGLRIKITGHTDSDGEEAANQTLSENRALAVKNALQTSYNIDVSRMETAGKGENAPVADNKSPEGKANNRRVEFTKL